MVEVVRYTNNRDIWDDFVNSSFNGTIFNKQKFLSYHIDKIFDDHSLVFKIGSNIVAVMTAASVDGTLVSHPGASFGGIVLKNNDISLVLEIVDSLIRYAQEVGFKKITMRLPPIVLCKYPTDTTEFCLFYRGFRNEYVELSTYVPLGITSPDYEVIRKAKKSNEKFVVVRESIDFGQYYPILINNLKKHNTGPAHSLEEVIRLKQLFPKDIILFGAYLKEKMIAGVLLFINNPISFETFYISQDYEYNDYYPINQLITRIMEWGVYNNFRCMNFGISTEEKGRKINIGLSKFKESFGGLDITRTTFVKDLD